MRGSLELREQNNVLKEQKQKNETENILWTPAGIDNPASQLGTLNSRKLQVFTSQPFDESARN
jgi:hypothetical protein